MKFLLLNGPNLNLLGQREPDIYGTTTLPQIEQMVVDYAAERGVDVDCFQSNHEGVLIDTIQAAQDGYDGIIYNPGAHTHYSYAIHDAITSIDTPVIEIHISDIDAREDFRRTSVIADACIGQVKGEGTDGYLRAFDQLLAYVQGS